jgi:hypothetical protein
MITDTDEQWGAENPVGSSHLPDGLVALGVVDEIPDVDHRSVL